MSCFLHWTTLQHEVRQLPKSNQKKFQGKVTASCHALMQNPPCMARQSHFGHYPGMLLSRSVTAAVSLFHNECKHAQLCDSGLKPQILVEGAPVTTWDYYPSCFQQTLEPHPLSRHMHPIPVHDTLSATSLLSSVFYRGNMMKSHTGQNVIALLKMLQKIKPNLLQLTAFRDVITVPVLVAVHSRVSSYRLIPYENKQVPHCHFPYCTLTPAGILCQLDKQSPDTLQDLSEQKKHRKRSGTCHISLPRNYSAPYVSGWG